MTGIVASTEANEAWLRGQLGAETVEADLREQAEIRLLEILAQSGTTFAEVLQSYRMVIFVLLAFSTALLLAALVLHPLTLPPLANF